MKPFACIYLSGGPYKWHHACDLTGGTLCGKERPLLLNVGDQPIVVRDHWVLSDEFCPKCRDLLVLRTDYGIPPSQWTNWPQSWLIIKRET